MNAFKNLKLSIKLATGFGTTIVLMLVISSVVYKAVHNLVDSAGWVSHTYEVIRVAEGVQASMVDMETGQRGFMVTGEDEYLEPYFNGFKQFDNLITKGQNLTSDNATQVQRWKGVAELKERWVRDVAEPEIDVRRKVTQGATALANFKEISARTVGKDLFDSIRGTLAAIDRQFANNARGRHLVTLATLDLVNMETGQRGFLLTGKDESLEPFNEGQKTFTPRVAELRSIGGFSNTIKSNTNKLEKQVAAWIAQAAMPEINARREMNKFTLTLEDAAQQLKNGQGKTLMDTTRAKLKEIIDVEEVLIVSRVQEQQDTSDSTISFTIFGTLFAIATSLGIGIVITRSVVLPLMKTNTTLSQIAEGDLTQRIAITSTDEVGQMASNFNAFADKLQSMITKISESTSELIMAAEGMATVTNQTSSGVQNQKIATEQVATAINEMSATVQEVATNAAYASTSASDANDESKEGNRVVNETIKAIENLANEVNVSAEVISKLKDDSVNIGAVLGVIKSIADQTNLLALNAAIEAARAGEQGRGFAVVADEVRTLAQRTQESTSEIESLIMLLQTGTEESVNVMGKSRNNAYETVEQAKAAGKSLASITNAVENILQVNINIATATEEQSAVAEEINRNVVDIQEISEQTALGAEQIANSSTKLIRLGAELQDVVRHFKI
jgi:methyl-accepting chemotaxis protein